MAHLKYCPRCNKTISIGKTYCAECESKVKSLSSRNYKDRMDKEGIKRDKFYKSKEWINIREHVLNKYNYLDIYDYVINGKITRATTVHHIIEVKEEWDMRLDMDNLIPLSTKSHIDIHNMYRHDKERTTTLLKKIKLSWNENIGKG